MPDPPRHDPAAALALAVELMAIPGGPGGERAVADRVAAALRAAGVPAGAIREDDAHRRTGLPTPAGVTPTGCLSAAIPGRGALAGAPRRMLSAHLDTVPLAVGSKPVRDGEEVRSGDDTTALGADDRAGVAAVLTAARTVLGSGADHPPLTFFFPVQEEVGVRGSRHADLDLLQNPQVCVNFDGSDPAGVIVGATGQTEVRVTIVGKPAHAGLNPELGVNAAVVAAVALAELQADGWHGLIERSSPDGGDRRGTANLGVVRGGDATNVVMPRCDLTAEVRGHDAAFREEIVAAWRTALDRAAAAVASAADDRAAVTVETHLKYEAFRLADDHISVRAAEAAVRAAGGEPRHIVGNGGLDANWLTARGLPTATLGCGQVRVHTTGERLDVPQFDAACRAAVAAACGA